MTSGDLAGWAIFFSTAAECSATLAGLVMVAVSVNVRQILAVKHLPARAAAAITVLCLILAVSLAALLPQTPFAYALEVDLIALLSWFVHLRLAQRTVAGHRELGRPWRHTLILILMGQLQVWPVTIGAVLLTLGDARGLYGVAATVCAALLVSALNAWVLLVEVLR
jgi:modulator of FtsH protease